MARHSFSTSHYYRDPIRRREEPQESRGEVRHIDPKTGEYITESKRPSKKTEIIHYFSNNRTDHKFLMKVKNKILNQGVGSLTDYEVERTHGLIKKFWMMRKGDV